MGLMELGFDSPGNCSHAHHCSSFDCGEEKKALKRQEDQLFLPPIAWFSVLSSSPTHCEKMSIKLHFYTFPQHFAGNGCLILLTSHFVTAPPATKPKNPVSLISSSAFKLFSQLFGMSFWCASITLVDFLCPQLILNLINEVVSQGLIFTLMCFTKGKKKSTCVNKRMEFTQVSTGVVSTKEFPFSRI